MICPNTLEEVELEYCRTFFGGHGCKYLVHCKEYQAEVKDGKIRV